MKKIYSLLLAASIAASCITPVCADEISNIRLKFDGRNITVTAGTQKSGGSYAVMIVKDGKTAQNPADVFAAAEAKSAEDKTISCSMVMPDERNGQKTDGKYVVLIKGKDSEIMECAFDYVTEDGKKAAMELLLSATEAELADLLLDSSAYRAAFVSSGLVFDDYDSASAAEKAEVHRVFTNSRTAQNAAEDFNKSVLVARINLSDKPDEWLEKSDMKFNGTLYRDSEAKKFIASAIKGKYDSTKSFDAAYELLNVLYLCNTAKYTGIEKVLSDYEDVLGLLSSSAYKTYSAMSGDRKQSANESIVLKLSKSAATSAKDIEKAISEAISGSSSSDSSKKNTGSSSGGSKIAVGTTTPSKQTETGTQEGFIDLTGFAWAEQSINALYKKNIVSGVGDNMYDPYGEITREAFVKMIVSAVGKHNPSAVSGYTDVKKGSWYESYVASAAENNIVSGIGDGLFGTGMQITRRDAAVIIAKCMGLENSDSDYKFNDDAEIPDYAKPSVYALYSAGIVSGTDNGMFAPGGSLTRAQAAVMIYNMLNYSPDSNKDNEPKGDTKYENKLNMLRLFGFLKGIENESFDADANMSAQKFAAAVGAMISRESLSEQDAAAYAVSSGIIDADFDLSGTISYNDAADILVGILGYKKMYPDRSAAEIASVIGLLSGVSNSGTSLKMGAAVDMLLNAAEIPILTIDSVSSGSGVDMSADKDNTIMSVYHDWYEVKGIVGANEYASLTIGEMLAKGSVKIDGDIYETRESGAENLLGRNVKAWVCRSDKEENYVVYAEEYRNTVTEIKADLIDDAADGVITYLEKKDSDKSKRIKISPVVKVIYNGRAAADFSDSDFKIQSGRLVCIDNNNDGTAEVVSVEEYGFMVADSISASSEAIYNIYKTPEKLSLKEDDTDITVYLNGERSEYTLLPEKSVLAIMQSRDTTDKIVKIEASDKKVTGNVSNINSADDEITVDGEVYSLSECYTDARDNGDTKCVDIKVGGSYTFYLDIFGDIAYVEEDSESDYKYAYIKKFVYDDADLESDCSLRYLTMDSKWETAKLADKVKYNSAQPYKRSELFELLGGSDSFVEQLVKIKTNSKGEITALNTAEERSSYIDSSFNKREATGTWGVNNFSLSSKIFTFDDTKVVRVPKAEKADENDYAITSRSMFVVDNGYTVTAYDVDNFNYAKVLVLKQDSSIGENTLPFVVTKVATESSDGEIRTRLTGVIGENSEYSIVGNDENSLDGIEKGDVVQLEIGVNGRAKSYNKLFSASRYGEKINPAEMNKASNDVAGTISDIDRSGGRVKLDNGATGGLTLLRRDSKVVLYDMKKDKAEEISFAELEKGDYMYARLEWSRVRIIYAIRK